jgi:hypothetical protein
MCKLHRTFELGAALFIVAATASCNQRREVEATMGSTDQLPSEEQGAWEHYHLGDLSNQSWLGIEPGLTSRDAAYSIVSDSYVVTSEVNGDVEILRWRIDAYARFDSRIEIENGKVILIELLIPSNEINTEQVIETFGDPLVFILLGEQYPENHCAEGYLLHYADYNLNVQLNTTVDDRVISRETPVTLFQLYSIPMAHGYAPPYITYPTKWIGFGEEYCVEYFEGN